MLLASCCAGAQADSRLLYLEAQAVGGYSSALEKPVYYSMHEHDAMQKPSLGADYVQKLSGENGDWATLALQPRLVWNESGGHTFEPQLYNAYIRVKTPYCYAWAGHNRPAAGLESYFDTHAALLQALPMYGFGFDRDWGVGASRDFDWGDSAFSLTTGSGMPLLLDGGYLASARAGRGVLNADNYTAGVYFSGGRVPDVQGYDIMDTHPMPYGFFGVDAAYLWDRLEFRADLRKGEKDGSPAYAALGRIGLNVLEENRLKLEFQPVFTELDGTSGYNLAGGFSYAATAELSWRSLYQYDNGTNDKRITTQLYYYLKI